MGKSFPQSEASHQQDADLLFTKLSEAFLHSAYALTYAYPQKNKNDQEHPIAFKKCQEYYATIKKEVYALIFSKKKN